MKTCRWLTLAIASIGAFTQCVDMTMAESDGDRVIAIDVLLLPDATMLEHAKAANAALRENYPQGYTLGGDQTAHITLVHRYVREKDLPATEKAVAKISARAKPLRWQLAANAYRYGVWSGLAITNIVVERTEYLDDYQRKIVDAVQPFAVDKGTAEAFSTTRELPKIEHEIIDYVQNFVPKSSDENYNPHVTIGVAHEDFVKELQKKPFEKFTFKPAGVAIYQLGNFGTAQKKLWVWKAVENTK
ncbi:MAG TPA: hypothetical protein VHU84_17095 [Lacipirellulaceae bacterium]|jgi:2'-5' RNA ligase|nr:hypothetical protein [Lacipirellulaceae bacterium]